MRSHFAEETRSMESNQNQYPELKQATKASNFMV
jgi:hypothetical protein